MGIGNSRQQSTQANQRIGNKEKKSERAGIVYEVILDENNEAVKDSPIPSTQKVGEDFRGRNCKVKKQQNTRNT